MLTARFTNPRGIWGDGSTLFVADTGNHAIRKIDLQKGIVSTIAGSYQGNVDGNGSTALLNSPTGIWGDGNNLYVVDSGNNRIRRLSPPGPESQPAASPAAIPYRIADRGGMSLTSYGAEATRVGYARVIPAAGSTSPTGMAIFGFRQGGVLVSEAAVAASAPMRFGRIYVEIRDSVNTGVAIANSNPQPARVSFYFTDVNGVNQLAGAVEIAANTQVAAFLDQLPFFTNESFRPRLDTLRTFTFTSLVPIGVVALRGITNERSEFLITTLPVTAIDQTPPVSVSFPHFADGGGWKTQLVLINPADTTISGSIQFLTLGVPAPFNYSIPPRGSFKLETSSTDALIRTGWVRVFPATGSVTPSGLLLFSYHANGVTVSEAGVAALPYTSASRLYVETAGDFNVSAAGAIQTGFAIGNPSTTDVTISLELTTLDGKSTGLTGKATVPGSEQVAMFLNQIEGFRTLPTPFQGVLRISGANVFVAGLRGRYNERGDFLITTTPPVDETATVTSELLFSHFADGGGYSTQFVLFSGSAGPIPNGSLRFLAQTGRAIGLTLK